MNLAMTAEDGLYLTIWGATFLLVIFIGICSLIIVNSIDKLKK